MALMCPFSARGEVVFNLYPPSKLDPEEFAPRSHPGIAATWKAQAATWTGRGTCTWGALTVLPARALEVSGFPSPFITVGRAGTKGAWRSWGWSAVPVEAIASCCPSLSCLVCKIGATIPSLPTLKGLHKDARIQRPGKCLGHESVFCDPPPPLFLLLVLLSSKGQSDSGLCSCGWWAKSPFLTKQQAGGWGARLAVQAGVCLKLGCNERPRRAVQFPLPGKPQALLVRPYRVLPGLPPPGSPPQSLHPSL